MVGQLGWSESLFSFDFSKNGLKTKYRIFMVHAISHEVFIPKRLTNPTCKEGLRLKNLLPKLASHIIEMYGALELKVLKLCQTKKHPKLTQWHHKGYNLCKSQPFSASFCWQVFSLHHGTFSCKASLCLLICFNLRIALRRGKKRCNGEIWDET